MSRPYSSKTVANTIIKASQRFEIKALTPMKLQKLVYYCEAWCLALNGNSLITDEIEAWTYGPVISDIYHEYKGFGDTPVDSLANELAIVNGQLSLSEPVVPDEDFESLGLIQSVLERYGSLSAIQLSNMTHQDGEPWKIVADEYPDSLPRNIVIPKELIKDCFGRLLHRTGEE
jgi:uncharacterized phage-associated protein